MEYVVALKREYMDKKTMSLAEAQEFVNNNAYKIENFHSRCVDGRYEAADQLAGVAKPGGDAGTAMIAYSALNKLKIHPEPGEVFSVVEQVVGGAEKFKFHTDTHAEHDNAAPGTGCGHLKQAKNDPSAYGLEQGQIDYIFSALPALVEKGARQEVLPGDHGEQAVLVVVSQSYSIKPKAGEAQVFVYQKTLDEQIQEHLAQALHEHFSQNFLGLTQEQVDAAVTEVAAEQLQQTVSRLAQGLPVYVVKITENGSITVEQ